MLGVIYLCMLSFTITQQAVPPNLPLIMQDLGLTHAEAGWLMSLVSVPALILAIPAGMLADRYGQRQMGSIAFALMISG